MLKKLGYIDNLLEIMQPKQKEITFPSGEELRDIGMVQAETHADEVHPKWSDLAYKFLEHYVGIKGMREGFLTEDIRFASIYIVPEPPSKRAWGGVVVRAVKNGIIHKVGYRNVTNEKAHCTPATLWNRTKFTFR